MDSHSNPIQFLSSQPELGGNLQLCCPFPACVGSLQPPQHDRNWTAPQFPGQCIHTAPQKLLLISEWGNDLSTPCSCPHRAGITGWPGDHPCDRSLRFSLCWYLSADTAWKYPISTNKLPKSLARFFQLISWSVRG